MSTKRKSLTVGLLTVEESHPTEEDAGKLSQEIVSKPAQTADFVVVSTKLDIRNDEILITRKLDILIREHRCNVIFTMGGISPDNDAARKSLASEFLYTDLQDKLRTLSGRSLCARKQETIIINLPSELPDALSCFEAIKEDVARESIAIWDIPPEEIASRSLLYDIGDKYFVMLDADADESHRKPITYKKARQLISEFSFDLDIEKVPLEHSLHRIIAETIRTCPEAGYPLRDTSLVDGLAGHSSDGAGLRIVQTVDGLVRKQHVVPVSAAAWIPENADSVTPMQDTYFQDITANDELRVMLTANPKLEKNVKKKGSEISTDKAVVSEFTRMTASLITTCASVGKTYIEGLRKPSIAILTIANKIKDYVDEPEFGDPLHLSKLVLINYLKRYHHVPTDYGTVRNRYRLIKQKLDHKQFLYSVPPVDVLITIGGNFNGRFSEMEELLNSYKAKIVFSNVGIHPGGTTLFAFLPNPRGKRGKIVFCLPSEISSLSNVSLYNVSETDKVIPVRVAPGPSGALSAFPPKDNAETKINILSGVNGYTIFASKDKKTHEGIIDVTLFDDVGTCGYQTIDL